MSRHHSPWRVNDAVLYDALRDEFRSSVAASMKSDDGSDDGTFGAIQRLRAELYSVDGFNRAEVTGSLNDMRSRAVHNRAELPRD